MKILIVEDNPALLDLIHSSLQKEGFTCEKAADFVMASEKIALYQYDILLFFISNPNRVITKESIAEHIWGDNMDLADSFDFIYSHIKNLRKKITSNKTADPIKAVYGIGYKLNII